MIDDLDINSYRLLKKLLRAKGYIDIDDHKRELDCLFNLICRESVDVDSYGGVIYSNRYKINNSGITYVLQHKSRTRRIWVPIWISIAALIISGIALANNIMT